MAKFSIIIFYVLFYQLSKPTAQSNGPSKYCNVDSGNYTSGSVYQQNLNSLFSDLNSQTSARKFYDSTAGRGRDKLYGLYQCREDLSLELCRDCVQTATRRIVQLCPLYGEAIVWYYKCMLRYSNSSINSLPKTTPAVPRRTVRNITDNRDQFLEVLQGTLNTVISEAALTNTSWGHFATASNYFTSFDQVYCLAQCTPDLSRSECNICLRSALAAIRVCCSASTLAAVFLPSCQLRYDMVRFFNVTTHVIAPAPPPSNPSKSGSGLKPPIIAAVVAGATVGVLLLTIALWLYFQHRRKAPAEAPRILLEDSKDFDNYDLGNVEFVQYEFATLKAATSDFSSDNKLGEGGFGAVYRGILPNGQVIAIKRLSENSRQGAKEFMTEARLVAKLQHKNLVKLSGFCSQREEKLLVYEYLPNSSVDTFLFDPQKQASLDWKTRFKIIIGIARGLQYLHEDSRLTIVHRDLKPSNILLDEEMNPKIADFGMAKLFGAEQNLGNTSRIVGTYGYMAPEYMLMGEYSYKSDVYSFGIMILELVSGQKNKMLYQSSQDDIPMRAWRLWNSGQSFELIDPTLNESAPRYEVMKCIQIGLLCVQGDAVNRPTMAALLLMLTGSITLPLPVMSPHHITSPEFESNKHQNVPNQSSSKSVSWSNEVERDLYPR